MNKIIHGNCLKVMKRFPDDYVDMVLTSPPYDKIRTYNSTDIWGEHIWKFVIQQLHRILKEGGVVVWIVGDETIDGSETGTSFKQALYFKKIGFNLHDTMIWEKPTFTAVGALSVRYAQVFEYMFIFSKGKINTFHPIKDRKNKYAGISTYGTVRQKDGSTKPLSKVVTIGLFGQRFNIWRITPKSVMGHPAPFPLRLAKDHIISWSNKGDVILDPFAGSGTTGVACINMKRKYILIEKDKAYIKIIKQRIRKRKKNRRLLDE